MSHPRPHPHQPPDPSLLDEYLLLTEQLEQTSDLITSSPDTAPTLLPHQVPPPSDPTSPWSGWVLTGGRGVGKTMAGSRWLADLARSTPYLRGRIIAPQLSDAVNGVVLDPDSGIMAADPTATFRPSGVEGVRVTWPNHATIWCVGTPTLKDVDRLRALTNIDVDLFEEAAANPQLPQVVTQAALSRRGSRLPHPIWAATTTPRPVPTLKEWMADPQVVITHATTYDNPHTPDAYRTYADSLRGTRYYRQEVLGEIVADVEGALWSLQDLERSTVPIELRPGLVPTLSRVVIGVDPPSGMGTCGIVVVGQAPDGHLYVLEDRSVSRAMPHQWGTEVSYASRDYADALVVAETNQGGTMVQEVLRNIDPSLPLTTVTASVGKQARAEPIAMLWEAEHPSAHLAPTHPGALDDLTLQLTEWVPEVSKYSPDRLDALVWGCAYLKSRQGSARAVLTDPSDPASNPASPAATALGSPRLLPASSFARALQGG